MHVSGNMSDVIKAVSIWVQPVFWNDLEPDYHGLVSDIDRDDTNAEWKFFS